MSAQLITEVEQRTGTSGTVTEATALHHEGRHRESIALLRHAARHAESSEGRAALLTRACAVAATSGSVDLAQELAAQVHRARPARDVLVTFQVLDASLSPDREPARAAGLDHHRAARTLVGWDLPAAAFTVLATASSADWSAREVRAGVDLVAGTPGAVALEGLLLMRGGSLTAAVSRLQLAAYGMEDLGADGAALAAYACLAEAATCVGQSTTADHALDRAAGLARATGVTRWQTHLGLSRALLAARQGRGSEPSVVSTLHHAVLVSDPVSRARAELVQGVDLLCRERWDEAFDALEPLVRRLDATSRDLVAWGLLSHFADAASHSHQVGTARHLLSRLGDDDDLFENDVELAELLYATAVLSQAEYVDSCYEALLALDLARWPWLRARAHLAYGEQLRRMRCVTESRRHLTTARRLFEAMGSGAWEGRAVHELRAAGVRGEATIVSPGLPLSPQELEIVLMAASGLSNREIGRALFLSPRTIGSHLYRIFPKLDITSRNQLSAVLAQAGDQRPTGASAASAPATASTLASRPAMPLTKR